MEEPALTFAGLLRRLRAEARLTQEELAEAAGVSPRSVSDLERGINRTARKDTAVLLAGALGLPGTVAELFVAAARGRGPAGDVVAARRGAVLGAFAAAATRGLSPASPAAGPSLIGWRKGWIAWPPAVGLWGSARSAGWPGSARPRSRCTRPTGWLAVSPTASFTCPCTPTPVVSGRWTRRMRCPACC